MLKIIAIVSMVIDHIGFMFFPNEEWMRILGRIAFPIFAFQIAQGMTYTSDIRRYMKRLIFFGLLSAVPYYLSFGKIEPNIILSFFFAVCIGFLWERKANKFLILLLLIILFLINIEYGLYGIATIFLFKKGKFFWFIPLTTIKSYIEDWWIQLFALLALPLLFYAESINQRIKIHINKWFFYWFYPVHLFILYVLKVLFES